MKIYLLLSSILTLLYGCPMAIRENLDEPEEITSQSVAVPGASCVFEGAIIVEQRVYARVEESVDVTCEEGYQGGGEWTCLSDGTFSGTPCERITCAENIPQKLGNDDIVILSGESLDITCDEGYGNAGTWSCSIEGELTGNPCRKKCEQEVENLLGADSFVAFSGDIGIELNCDEGYFSESIYSCDENGEFNTAPSCEPINCESFSAVANSNILESISGKKYGEEVSVLCEAGKYGNQNLSCNSDGSWNEVSCQDCVDGYLPSEDQKICELIECSLTFIENASVALPFGDYFFGDFNVTCEDGYEGGGDYRCREGGWVGAPCRKKSCADTSVDHSNFSGDDGVLVGNFQTTQEIVCDEGFTDNGATVNWTCELDGGGEGNVAWQGPSCERKTCDTLDTGNIADALDVGEITGKKYEDTYNVACRDGFVGGETTCGTDGSWSAVACIPADCSVGVDFLADGKTQLDAINGQELSLNCVNGYEPSHGSFICGGGDFNNAPSCNPVVCNALTPDNSSTNIALGNYESDEVAVVCDEGYAGGGNWSCSAEGAWEGTACIPKVCEEVSINFSSSHTELSATNYDPDIIQQNIVCDDGYTGGGNWSCNVDGIGDVAWEGSICEPATCTSRALANSPSNLDEVVYDPNDNHADYNVTCQEGYEPSSDEPWVCAAIPGGAQWQGPSCEVVTCPAKPKVNFTTEGTTDFPSGVYDDTHTMTCADGYDDGNGNNSSTWTCNQYGSWVGSFCRKTGDCMVDSTNLASGQTRIVADEGETVSVYCDYGYEPIFPTLTCSSDGSGGSEFNHLPAGDSYCSRVECSEQGSPVSNSGTTIGPGFFNDTVSVSCNGGFVGETNFSDTPTWTCGGDGNWSGEACVSYCEITVENSIEGTYKIPEGTGRLIKCDSDETTKYKGNAFVTCTDAASDTTDIEPVCEVYTISTPEDQTFNEYYAIEDEDVDCDGDVVNFPDHSFVLEMDSGANGRIHLPVDLSVEGIDFYVDWGDQTCSHISSSSASSDLEHDYVASGYGFNEGLTLRITGTLKKWGNASNNNYKDRVSRVVNLGSVGWEDLSYAFYDSSITEFNSLHSDTSNVLDMSNMFRNANRLTFLDLSSFDTSNVEDMEGMFYDASSLTTLDLSSFNTSNVTSMSYMFYNASGLETLDISNFDTSNVTNMSYMFKNANSLNFLDLSSFNTSNVTSMSSMFYRASGLETLDISNFDTSNVTSMSSMFYRASGLETLDLSHFDTSNVEDMSNMFAGTSGLETLDISNFDTSNVTSMYEMFKDTFDLTSLDLSSFNTSNVTSMSYMFYNAIGLETLDISNFDTSNVTSMSSMFYRASGLETLDISSFNTSNVEDMEGMFYDASSLTTLDLSSFNTSNVISMNSMFSHAMSLTFLDISSFDTSNVTNMNQMFYKARGLETLDLSNFDTSKVKSMQGMFSHVEDLTSLDLSSFDTSNVSDMSYMFRNTDSLTSLDLSNFDTGKVLDMYSMFLSSRVERLNLSNFYTKYAANMGSMLRFNNAIEKVNFGKWVESSSTLAQSHNFTGSGWSSGSLPTIYCDGAPPSGLTALVEDLECLPPPMIVTFTTTSSNEEVTLGINGGSISVDWGDGDEDSLTTHSYDNAGTYEVWIEGANTITTVDNNWSNNLVKVNSLGDLSSVTTFTNPFKDKTNLKLFSGFGKFRTLEEGDDGVDLSSWFEGATSLKHVDFSKIDTSNVSNTSDMFKNATSLTHVNLGDFNHSVGTTTDMFSGTEIVAENTNKFLHCSKEYDENETNLNWNTTIGGVSYKCENNLMPIVLEVGQDPATCSGFTFTLNNDLQGIVDWGADEGLANNSNSYTYTDEQLSGFNDCKTTVKIWGEYDTNGYNFNNNSKDKIVSVKSFGHNVYTNANSAFENTSIISVGGYGRFGSVSMHEMFRNAESLGESLATVDFSNIDTSNVTDMSSMFYGASALTSLDLSSFDTSNVEDMAFIFFGTSSLEDLDLSSFDTSNVTSMSYMFRSTGLETLDLSNFDTSNVTNMDQMFYNASGLETLDISNFDTSNVTNIRYMFYNASDLTSLDLSSFDTSNVEDMSYMFGGTSSLSTLNLSNFDTSNVTNMSAMFWRASGLSSLNLGFWETDSLSDSSSFFSNSGNPNFSSSGENTNLICLNDDDATSEGNELFINGNTYSCDGGGE